MLCSAIVNTLFITIGIVCAVGIIFSIVLQLKRSSAPLQQDLSGEVTRLQKDLEAERAEKNKLAGGNKQLFAEHERLKAEFQSLGKEKDQLKTTLTKFEAGRETQEKEHRNMIEKLESAQQALRDERQRVIQADEERKKTAEEERDRLWNEHENAVIAHLLELCKQPQFQFTCFSNSNLPEKFDGSLKPDFLIEFLGQYVIFDAKASKAQSLQTYIDDAVKKTAEKVRKNSSIYPHIFLVVPTEAISELKKLIYAKDEYYFYIVSREALAPILASLKRISTYELAETLDPQKRENIINMIAELASHIGLRNAHEILLTKMGADTLERIHMMDTEIAKEIEQKQAEKKPSQLSASDIKRLASSIAEQNIELHHIVAPKAAVSKKAMEEAMQQLV